MANDDGTPAPSRKPSEAVAAYYARGEQAWQDYLRTGVSSTLDEVFARLDARIAGYKARLLHRGPAESSSADKQC